MAKIEPGAYEPRDDIRVFDGADDDVDDEGSRLPLLIVIALLVLAAFAGVVYLAYTEGVQKGRADAPRVITAEPGPAKVAPTDGGGTVTPYKGLKIYEQPAPSDEEADSAPPPPTAVKPQAAAPAAAPTPTAAPVIDASSPPPAAPKPAPKATAKADVPTAKAPVAASTTTTKLAMAAPAKSNVTAPAAQPPVATAPPRSLVPAHETGTAATVKATKPEAADTASPTKTTMAEPPAAKPAARTTPPVVAPKPVESKTAEAEPAPVKSGKFVVQLASYPTEADATAAFASMKAKSGGLLGGYSANIKRVDLGPKGVWYRLRVGAFADKEEAAALSAKLGGGSFATKP